MNLSPSLNLSSRPYVSRCISSAQSISCCRFSARFSKALTRFSTWVFRIFALRRHVCLCVFVCTRQKWIVINAPRSLRRHQGQFQGSLTNFHCLSAPSRLLVPGFLGAWRLVLRGSACGRHCELSGSLRPGFSSAEMVPSCLLHDVEKFLTLLRCFSMSLSSLSTGNESPALHSPATVLAVFFFDGILTNSLRRSSKVQDNETSQRILFI